MRFRWKIRELFLELKSCGSMIFIPLFIVDIVFPISCLYFYHEIGLTDVFWSHVIKLGEAMLPITLIWCAISSMKDYLNSGGNELLYTLKKPWQKTGWYIFAVFSLNCLIWYALFSFFKLDMGLEYIRLIFIGLFQYALGCTLMMLSRSSFIALLVMVLYNVAVAANPLHEKSFVFYICHEVVTGRELLLQGLFYMLVSAILMIVADGLNKKIRKFY